MAKDFTGVNTGRVYDTIKEATAQGAQEGDTIHKNRRTYSKEEAAALMEEMKTAGRKGLGLPRVNLAFNPSNYDYIKTMSRVQGLNLTQFVNLVIRQHMEEHGEIYRQAKAFRDALDN